jgi:hypothetical protein
MRRRFEAENAPGVELGEHEEGKHSDIGACVNNDRAGLNLDIIVDVSSINENFVI